MGGRGGGSPATRQDAGGTAAPAVQTPAVPTSRLASDVNPTITGKRTYQATATIDGKTVSETRTTERDYTHAAVVQGISGQRYIASFHGSEALAAKGVLTGSQRRGGMRVVQTIPLEVIKSKKKAS